MSNSKTFSLKNNKRGFTLIELSIVLIIIGLLIVAVNSGTSLIRNAKLRSVTNEAKQYQVAVNSFFMKFDKYPGDFKQSLGEGNDGSVPGDGDDQIEWRAGSVNEGLNAWLQLIDSGVLKEDIRSNMTVSEMKANTDSTIIPIKHYPPSAENSAGWIFNSVNDNNIITNYVQIVKSFSSGFGVDADAPTIAKGAGAALNAADAFSIDNKNDDGVRNSGDIREVVTLSATANDDCDASDDGSVSGIYDLNNPNADVCSLAFKVTIN